MIFELRMAFPLESVRWLIVLVAVGAACLVSHRVDAAAPVEAYGRLPSLEDLALSPDGTRVAFVRTSGDARNLFVADLSTGKELGGAHLGDYKLRFVEWLDNGHLLTAVSTTSLPPIGFTGPLVEWWQLAVYDVDKRRIFPIDFRVDSRNTFNVAAGQPVVREIQGVTKLFVPGLYVTDRTLPGLFTYDLASGRMRLIREGGGRDTHWLIDEAGHVVGQFVYDDTEKRWALGLDLEGHRTRTVASGTAPIDVPSVIGFDSTGQSVIMDFLEGGRWVWRAVSLQDGSMGPALGEGATFRAAITSRTTGRILGGIRDSAETKYVFFDNELQAHWNAVLRAFPDERVDLVSHSDDYSRMIVRVFGPKSGYVYALFDWYTHQTRILRRVYDEVSQISAVQVIGYRAADGMKIPAILTLPHDRGASRLPLVVLPHGGPAVADSARFDWWAQALADQGYAVLQPNYRGSDLDRRHLEAGFGEWGRKMQTDLSDGVRYLAERGTIDPHRVCIVGASYGGYAALAGVTLDAGVYRCAVSDSGMSDLRRMLIWTNQRHQRDDNLAQRYWDRFMGVSGPDDPALEAISPIEHIAAITAPILLIHGKDDTVVPYEQSEEMASALKKAGKPVQFVTLKREDHWLSRSATRLQMLESTIAFLRANNPPD